MTKTIQTKQCSKCKQIKPFLEFSKNKANKDGFRCYCKSCQKLYAIKYQKTEKGKISNRKAEKKYRITEKGKIARHKAIKKFNSYHPNQKKAINAVNNAIRDGKLPRPDTLQCQYGKHPAEQYHHPNHAKEHQLDVVPVCIKCHNKIHNTNILAPSAAVKLR